MLKEHEAFFREGQSVYWYRPRITGAHFIWDILKYDEKLKKFFAGARCESMREFKRDNKRRMRINNEEYIAEIKAIMVKELHRYANTTM
jgi:hypothetical protein